MNIIQFAFISISLIATPLLAQEDSAWVSSGETVKFLGGAGEIFIPKGLKVMPPSVINVKYSGSTKPKEVYSDAYGYVSFGIKPTGQKITEASLPMYLEMLVNAYGGMYGEDTVWRKKEIVTVGETKVALMSYEEPAAYGGAYNMIFVAVVQREAIEFFFNCNGNLIPTWEPKAAEILESLKVLWN